MEQTPLTDMPGILRATMQELHGASDNAGFRSCDRGPASPADIDEAAWSAIYSTVSRPFDLPKTGKIAIKVINHYGDEVLKTFSI